MEGFILSLVRRRPRLFLPLHRVSLLVVAGSALKPTSLEAASLMNVFQKLTRPLFLFPSSLRLDPNALRHSNLRWSLPRRRSHAVLRSSHFRTLLHPLRGSSHGKLPFLLFLNRIRREADHSRRFFLQIAMYAGTGWIARRGKPQELYVSVSIPFSSSAPIDTDSKRCSSFRRTRS